MLRLTNVGAHARIVCIVGIYATLSIIDNLVFFFLFNKFLLNFKYFCG